MPSACAITSSPTKGAADAGSDIAAKQSTSRATARRRMPASITSDPLNAP